METFIYYFENGILVYCIFVVSTYVIQGLVATFQVKKYLDRSSLINDHELLESPYLPKISLIAPAFNESPVVKDAVRSLLSVQYFNLELVIVNDGSTDDTLEKLINEYDLQVDNTPVTTHIKSNPVRNKYVSSNPVYANLIVIDKENGRKADAVNAGINYCSGDYIAIVDLDGILEPNTFTKLIEPILSNSKQRVVAVGGIIGATNDSLFKRGKLIKIKTPESFYPRVQVIEYLRSFLFGRPAWSSYNGLMLISGALGLFDREILFAVDGFSHDSIGEDMDVVMKIHKYCSEMKMNYKIDFIPIPLCWTELPTERKVLSSQRNRWMRGTIQVMVKFRKMFLNPKYGMVGMVSYPAWFFSELCAPIIELAGMAFIIFSVIYGIINFQSAVIIFLTVYLICLFVSFYAITLYNFLFYKFQDKDDLYMLFKAAMVEAFIYHPQTIWWSLRGYYIHITDKTAGWGNMTRVGLKKQE